VLGFVSIVPTTAPADTTIASHEPSSTRASGEPIQLRVDRFELTEADIAFADLAASSKVDLTIRVPRLGVYDLEHGTKLPVPLRYEAVVEVPGVAEKTSLTGSITRDDSIAPVEVGCSTNTLCCLANIATELQRPVKWNPATLSFGDDKEAEAHRLYNYQYRNPYSL